DATLCSFCPFPKMFCCQRWRRIHTGSNVAFTFSDFLVTLPLLTSCVHQVNTDDSWRKSTMNRQLSKMSGYLGQISWLTLSLLIGLPLFGFSPSTHAAEAPGALTVIVKDQVTNRPLPTVQVTIT